MELHSVQGEHCLWTMAQHPKLPHIVELHQTVSSFGPQAMKSILIEFGVLCAELKEVGIKEIWAPGGREDKELFIKYLSFFAPDNVYEMDTSSFPCPIVGKKVL